MSIDNYVPSGTKEFFESNNIVENKYSLDEIDKLNHAYLNSINQPVKKIYLELPYIQDIFLGTLLTMTANDERYEYIIKNIPTYNKRIYEDVALYFPELNISHDQLLEYLDNENNLLNIISHSPHTYIYEFLFDKYYPMLINMNKVSEYGHKVELIINTYPIKKLPTECMYFFYNEFNKVFKNNIQLGFMSQRNDRLSEKLISSFNHFFIYDLISFLQKENIAIDLIFNKMQFLDKHIVAKKAVDKRLNLSTKREIETAFIHTSSCFDIFTNLHFMEPTILVDE